MFKDNFRVNFLFFFILIIIAFLRTPYIFLNGRIMYGDAYYFQNALNNEWYTTLFLIHKEAGYMNLFSNISSLLNAKIINIYYVPLFNVYLCFSLILIIIYLILFSKIDLFKTSAQKYLIAFIFLIAPSMVFEIWLDALNAQVYLGIISLLILFLEFKKKIEFYICPIILFIAGLSGVYSCLLTPLFLIKYFIDRKFIALINSIILITTSLLQLSFIFISKSSGVLVDSKINFTITSYEFISYSYNVLVRTFFSGSFPNFIISNFENLRENQNLLFIISFFILILFLVIFFLFLKKIISLEKKDKINFLYLLYFFICSSFLVIIGGVSDSISGRYSVIPGICLILIIFKLSFQNEKTILNYISIFLLGSTLIAGIYDFRDKKYITYYDCINCPNWQEEIKKLELNKNYEVQVWPYTKKKKINFNLENK